jgi:hypothetical protein
METTVKRSPFSLPRSRLVVLLLAGLMAGPQIAQAQEREDLEKLRATVVGLINTLVKNGVMSREQADAMMREAQRAADTQLAAAPPPDIGPDGKKIVRVPYVPEAVRTQMREQITAEVLAKTRGTGAAAPAGLTDAGSRFQVSGDIRLRAESIQQGSDNSKALDYKVGVLTRAADVYLDSNTNTQDDLDRTRIRARLGLLFAVNEQVTAGVTLSTGGLTGPTSTNQTMASGSAQGSYFNRYTLSLDRAFVAMEPLQGLRLVGGRFANPFMSTDLVWADDLNFEGFAATYKMPLNNQLKGFASAGWFPLSFNSGSTSDRSLMGIQGGVDWRFGSQANTLKVAMALYDYSGITGIKETTTATDASGYVVRSEYGANYRQRGNTLFVINSVPAGDLASNWGLASGFRELDLTASLDLALQDKIHLVLTGDVVTNLDFSRSKIRNRTGLDVSDGSDLGYMLKAQLGMPVISEAADWNVSLGYRRLGSDAVLDAFTSSDFGRGGTNNKGFTLGGSYGIWKNTWVSARWMSSDLVDSMVPSYDGESRPIKYSVDTLQLDLNVRF